MPQVTVSIAGRSYRMACGVGEEAHLESLAQGFDARITEMRKAFGEIGDMRLHVMAALTQSDELAEIRRRMAELEHENAELKRAADAHAAEQKAGEARLAEGLGRTAERIETLARSLMPVRVHPDFHPLAPGPGRRYMGFAGLRFSTGDTFPGALSTPSGAVPALVRGPGQNGAHLLCRFPGIDSPTALVASRSPPGRSPSNGLFLRACPAAHERSPGRQGRPPALRPRPPGRPRAEARAAASARVAERLLALPNLARHGLVGAYWRSAANSTCVRCWCACARAGRLWRCRR